MQKNLSNSPLFQEPDPNRLRYQGHYEPGREEDEEGADRRGIDGNTKAYLCTVCHKGCVDAEAGYDTCGKCLKNI